jgi:alkylmercury lyase
VTSSARLEEWAQAVAHAAPSLDDEEKQITIATYRLLAQGGPVSEAQIASKADVPIESVQVSLGAWPLVLRDEQGRVIGFWGLHVHHVEPTHAMTVDGTTMYGWCAEDTLFIPEILGRSAQVTSTDPKDGTPIHLTVTSEGIADLDPPEAVVSLLLPEGGFTDDAIARFCHRIYFFSSPGSATEWIAGRPGMFFIPVGEAFELGRLINRFRLGDIAQAAPKP